MFGKLVPHVCIVFSLSFLVILILEAFNPHLGLLSGAVFYWFMASFCVIAFATAVVLIRKNRHEEKE